MDTGYSDQREARPSPSVPKERCLNHRIFCHRRRARHHAESDLLCGRAVLGSDHPTGRFIHSSSRMSERPVASGQGFEPSWIAQRLGWPTPMPDTRKRFQPAISLPRWPPPEPHRRCPGTDAGLSGQPMLRGRHRVVTSGSVPSRTCNGRHGRHRPYRRKQGRTLGYSANVTAVGTTPKVTRSAAVPCWANTTTAGGRTMIRTWR